MWTSYWKVFNSRTSSALSRTCINDLSVAWSWGLLYWKCVKKLLPNKCCPIIYWAHRVCQPTIPKKILGNDSATFRSAALCLKQLHHLVRGHYEEENYWHCPFREPKLGLLAYNRHEVWLLTWIQTRILRHEEDKNGQPKKQTAMYSIRKGRGKVVDKLLVAMKAVWLSFQQTSVNSLPSHVFPLDSNRSSSGFDKDLNNKNLILFI